MDCPICNKPMTCDPCLHCGVLLDPVGPLIPSSHSLDGDLANEQNYIELNSKAFINPFHLVLGEHYKPDAVPAIEIIGPGGGASKSLSHSVAE